MKICSRHFTFFIGFSVIFLAGCPSEIKKTTAINSEAEIKMSFPTDHPELSSNTSIEQLMDFIRLPSYSWRGKTTNGNFASENLYWRHDNSKFSVTRIWTSSKHFYTKSTIIGKLQISSQDGQIVLTIRPESDNFSQRTSGYLGRKNDILLTPEDIKYMLSANPIFHWKVEVDSPFSPESTYANFVRLAKQDRSKEAYKDPVTGKIFKDKFLIEVNDQKVSTYVETYPYKSGSKAVVYGVIQGTITENNIDFVQPTILFNKEVKRIIAS